MAWRRYCLTLYGVTRSEWVKHRRIVSCCTCFCRLVVFLLMIDLTSITWTFTVEVKPFTRLWPKLVSLFLPSFESMKSLGVCYWYVKMPRCGCVEHGLGCIKFYVHKHKTPLAACSGPPLVRGGSLGASAFVRLACCEAGTFWVISMTANALETCVAMPSLDMVVTDWQTGACLPRGKK